MSEQEGKELEPSNVTESIEEQQSPGANAESRIEGMADSGFEENAVATTSVESMVLKPVPIKPEGKCVYSREELLSLRNSKLSQVPPVFVNDALAPKPQKFQKVPAAGPSIFPRHAAPDNPKPSYANGFRSMGIKDKMIDEQDGIVLGPQRKSFVGGCHPSFANPRRDAGPDLKLEAKWVDSVEMTTPVPIPDPSSGINALFVIPFPDLSDFSDEFASRASRWDAPHWRWNDIGRGRGRSNFMPRLPNPRPAEKEWNNRYDRNEPHERRFPRDRQEAADGRDFQRPSHHDSQHGRYDNHRHHNRYHHAEEEPEWFTGGPTSQNETIELHGFDDEVEQLGKNKSAKTATSEPTLAGSRPPSSVDPVQEPCEGVRHSSPLPSGKSPEKKDGTLKGTEEETPKNFPMDFDGFFVGAEPEEVATSTGSRFRRFFTRQFEEENPGIEKESSAAEHKKNASDLINDQYSAPKNDPHARQTGRVSGESCELGGEILHLFRNALPDKNSVNRDGHSESLEKRAHIRELAIQGKVMNVSEIEGQRVEREPLPQSFHPPGNDMSAFQKLSTGYMGTVRPTLVVPGTNDRQIFMNNPGPLFQNQPYMGNKTTSSGLLDAIKDRRQQSFAVSEQLKKGVPLEEIEIPKPSFQPPTNKGAVSYPRDFAASMCMAGLDVERLSRPEAQYILKGLVDGRLSKLQIQFFSGASGQPENMKQAYAAVNRALECRFDPVSLLGDQGVKSLQDSGTRKPMLAAAPPPPLPGNVAFRPPSIPMSAGPPMMNEPSPREIAFQTQQLMNDAKMKQQQARMQQLMQQQAQIQARQEFQAQMQQMQADDFRRRQAEHQQQHLLHQIPQFPGPPPQQNMGYSMPPPLLQLHQQQLQQQQQQQHLLHQEQQQQQQQLHHQQQQQASMPLAFMPTSVMRKMTKEKEGERRSDAEAVDQLAKLMARAGVQSRPLPLIPGEKIMSVADLERNLNAQPRIN